MSAKRTQVIEECIERIMTGRTAVNFGHVPEVSRALDWLVQELRELAERGRAMRETERRKGEKK